MDAIAIKLAGLDARNVAVPDKSSGFAQKDSFSLFTTFFEEAQLNRSGVLRVNGKINASAVPLRA